MKEIGAEFDELMVVPEGILNHQQNGGLSNKLTQLQHQLELLQCISDSNVDLSQNIKDNMDYKSNTLRVDKNNLGKASKAKSKAVYCIWTNIILNLVTL